MHYMCIMYDAYICILEVGQTSSLPARALARGGPDLNLARGGPDLNHARAREGGQTSNLPEGGQPPTQPRDMMHHICSMCAAYMQHMRSIYACIYAVLMMQI